MFSKVLSATRYLIALAMLYWLAQSDMIEWSALKGLFLSWHFTVLAVVIFALSTVVQAARLHILLKASEFHLPFLTASRLTFIGLFFSTYLPGATGGDLVKIYYVSKGNRGKRAEAITILLFDRFLGLYALLTLPLILAPFFPDLISQQKALQLLLLMSAVLAAAVIVFMVIAAQFELANNKWLLWIESKLPLGALFKRMVITIHSYRDNLPAFLAAVGYSYLSQLLMVFVAMLVARATLDTGAEPEMLLLVPMGYLANSLPFTPGGLGVGEAALESLFAMAGIHGGAETLLGWRLVMIITGLIGLVFYLRGEKSYTLQREQA